MAYDINNLTEEAQERLEKGKLLPGQASAMEMSDRTLELINQKADLLGKLGIELGEDGKLPEKDGVPRIFTLKADENGIERRVSLDAAGLKYGTREFWQQVQEGNIFAYPAGSEHAVQMKAEIVKERMPKVSYSAPLNMEKMHKAPQEYRKPGAFTRFLNSIFSNYRKRDCDIYRERQNLIRTNTKGMKQEMEDLKGAEKRAAEKADKEARKKAYETQAKEAGYKEKGKNFYYDLVAPQPKPHPEHMTTKDKTEFYTQEEFDSLKPIDKKFEDYTVGEKGKAQPISKEEYCGLVMACSFDEKVIDDAFKKESSYDDTLKQSLMNYGYSEKEAKKITARSYGTMVSDDIMKGNLRVKQGTHLEDSVNPARHQVFEILEQYKQGNKEPLAEKIAECISDAVSVTDEYTRCPENGAFNHFEFAAATADLLARDPELKKIAMEKGLKQKDIDAVNGMREYSKLDTNRGKAKTAIAKAVYEGNELSYQDKLKYTKDILAANIFEAKLTGENLKRSLAGKEIDKEQDRLLKENKKNGLSLSMEEIEDYAKNPGTRPMPEKGKLYDDQIRALMLGRKAEFNKHPEAVFEANDPEAMQDCREIAEDIIEQNGLAELSVKDLDKAMNGRGTMYSGVKLIEMAEKSAQKIQERRYYQELGIEGPQEEKNAELDKAVEYENKAPKQSVAGF